MTDAVPPAPWTCEATAVLWISRTPSGTRRRLRGALPELPPLPVTLGGLVVYHDTPVGPYGELFAAQALRRGGRPVGHVPFMAVDSAPSVAGGRANWALPKELARFDAQPDGVIVRGDGWAVRVRAAMRPRAVPLRTAGSCVQRWPDQRLRRFVTRFDGRARAAAVDVEHLEDRRLEAWLPRGRHPAVSVTGTLEVAAPDRA